MDSVVNIVEDDQLAAASVHALVQSLGLTSRRFPSGEEFLAQFDPALSGCLVADIRLPGISGIDLYLELDSRGSKLPVILVTAHLTPEIERFKSATKVVALLAKPYQEDQLVDAIYRALGKPTGNS